MHKTKSYPIFVVIRFLIKLFYPKIEVVGLENLPDEPAVVVANHCQMNGPISCELYFPGDRAIWCAGQMMKTKEVPAYAFQDFWSGKSKYTHWFYRLLSFLIAPVASCIFNNAHTIAVYRDSRIISTFKNTVKALSGGANVVIFPECYDEYNHIVHRFQENFIDIAKLYYKRTGKELQFCPMYIAPRLKKMYIGQPIRFDHQADMEAERHRISTCLMDAITKIAVELPEHIVVPYPNISSKLYTTNVPKEVTEHEETRH